MGDLLRFAKALQSGRLLDERFTAMEMTGQVPTGSPGVTYGFGMEERMIGGIPIVGHGGGGPGIEGVLEMYPTLGYVVAYSLQTMTTRCRPSIVAFEPR